MKNVEINGNIIKIGELSVQEFIELKKFIDGQPNYIIHWTVPTYHPLKNPYWQPPFYTTTCGTSTANTNQNGTTYTYYSTTSNDNTCVSSSGSHIQSKQPSN